MIFSKAYWGLRVVWSWVLDFSYWHKFFFCHSVIKYRVTHVEKNEHRKIVSLTGRVGRVFKVGNLTLSRGQSNVKIWRGTDSSCPFRFALHRSYAIGGYENDSHTKLLLSPTSLILKWSEKTLKKIRSWDRVEKGKKDKIGKRSVHRQGLIHLYPRV